MRMCEWKDPLTGKIGFTIIKNEKVCEECAKLDMYEMAECNHVPIGVTWKDEVKYQRVKNVTRTCFGTATFLRESAGVAIGDEVKAFKAADINRVFALPPVRLDDYVYVIWTCVDTSGLGNSEMSCISGYHDGTNTVVCDFLLSSLSLGFFLIVGDFFLARARGTLKGKWSWCSPPYQLFCGDRTPSLNVGVLGG